jgi:aarF domain-containing kinase
MASNSWMKVAAGARLVASAVLERSATEASIAANRATRHGIDVSSKAHQTIGAVSLPSLVQEALASLNERSRDVSSSNNKDYDTTTVKAGTAPYESQLRKKRERIQQNDQKVDNLTESYDQQQHQQQQKPNPYLLHARHQSASATEKAIPQSQQQQQQQQQLRNTQPKPLDNDPDMTMAMADENQIRHVGPDSASERYGVDGPPTRLKEGKAVPSSRIGRAFGFAKLGAGLAWGTAGELASRVVLGSGRSDGGSAVTNNANADRLAATLCRMRGAALKMGQMLSIQDESLLPPALTRALSQVRQGADAMPNHQLVQQMKSQLGDNWRDKFYSFDEQPFAAASIGQVHLATVQDKETGSLRQVVVKVQYPGVAQSIESDLGNLSMLVRMTGLAPKGLFIENVIRVGQDELKVECNYLNELANQESFKALVESDPILRENEFTVPDVFEDLTTEQVLTTAFSPGGTIDKVSHLDQEERNRIGRTILYLTMQELFEWRLMQTGKL